MKKANKRVSSRRSISPPAASDEKRFRRAPRSRGEPVVVEYENVRSSEREVFHRRFEGTTAFDVARRMLLADGYPGLCGYPGILGHDGIDDDFGLDPEAVERVGRLLGLIYRRYFRVRVEGLHHLPASGPALLVCNNGSVLPWEGLVLSTAIRLEGRHERKARWLVEDGVFELPFLGAFLGRIGAIRACPRNAERVLSRGGLLAVFPEGGAGTGKPYRDRYQLQDFDGRDYVEMALRIPTPVYPAAIVGAEDAYPVLHRITVFNRVLGGPCIPVTPLFPWFGPLGLIPLPSRWRIVVGEAVSEFLHYGAGSAEDAEIVGRLDRLLQLTMQSLLHRALAARGI